MTPLYQEMPVYRMRSSETEQLVTLLGRLEAMYSSPSSPDFLAATRRAAFSSLPAGLVEFLDRFYRAELPAVAVAGLPVEDHRIGPTPPHWSRQADPKSTLREELCFVLMSSILGDIFAWNTLQNGSLIHNVMPVRGEEYGQSAASSLALLAWHTEDAFHPYRGDYVGLMGLRNRDSIPTKLANIDQIRLPAHCFRTLFEPRFLFRPDDEHLRRHAGGDSKNSIVDDWKEPAPSAILFGDPRRPYLRIDPTFMSVVEGDRDAEEALRTIVRLLESVLTDYVIEAGTLCFIDNYLTIHGRSAFQARYDGTDRWLKKIVLTRDVRKSRALRPDPLLPILLPATNSEHGKQPLRRAETVAQAGQA